MKNTILLFLLLFTIKANSQANQTLELNNGQLKLYNNEVKFSVKPYTHLKLNSQIGGLFYISSNNVREEFWFINLSSFIVNGVNAPLTLTSVYDSLLKYQGLNEASSAGSSSASSVLQTTQIDTAAATNTILRNSLTTSTALPTNGVKALNVRQVQTTALVGTNIPTVTAYTTAANTVVTTNVNEIVIENMSLTTAANFTYGGQTFTLGFKGNGITPSFYHLKAPYNASSFKYSPFATLIVNAASSSVFVTKYFIQ